ncbi:MAG: hypothetical protein PWP65_1250 [Clostridia bacterium]|nr:hypothetical protein [Clostridia bacterium]
MLERKNIRADFLIIGGGSAGCMAAIRAGELNPEAEIVIFEKGHIRRSGTIAMGMDALNVVAVPGGDTPEDYIASLIKSCHKILDVRPSYVMAKRSFAILQRLESWGVNFPKGENGDYERLQVHPHGRFCVAMEAPDLKVILARKVKETGARVYNRVMATSLLTVGNRVVGATGLNLRTGEFLVCTARAVLLANGGASRFGLPNTGYLYGTYDYPGNAGDGYAMAFRAGAQLTGFECCMQTTIIKDANIPLLYITLTRGGKVINALGEEIDMGGTVSVDKMLREYWEGRGPLFIRLDHLPEDEIRKIESILFTTERPMQKRFFEERGLNFRQHPVEIYPTEIYLCGGHGMTGLVVDETAATTLEGLFAAGDVACVPRQHLTGAFVFGEIAAESAQEFLAAGMPGGLSSEIEEQANQEYNRLVSLINNPGGIIGVKEFEYKVRRIINDYLTSPKNELKLKNAILWMQKFREDLPKVIKVRDYHELARAVEIGFIIDCAELCGMASLARKESRWGVRHFRSDYPETDDANWLKHVILQRGNYPEINTSYKPVDHKV